MFLIKHKENHPNELDRTQTYPSSRRFRRDMSGEACDECLQAGQFGKIYELAEIGRRAWRRHHGRGGVEPLLRQLAAEDVAALECRHQSAAIDDEQVPELRRAKEAWQRQELPANGLECGRLIVPRASHQLPGRIYSFPMANRKGVATGRPS